MRQLHAEGKLTPAQAALMARRLPEEELYDTEKDPHEIHNLAQTEDAGNQRILKRLRAELDRWIAETKDQGSKLEPAEIVAPFDKEMHEWFGTPEWAKGKR
jgi:hypothetical protein